MIDILRQHCPNCGYCLCILRETEGRPKIHCPICKSKIEIRELTRRHILMAIYHRDCCG